MASMDQASHNKIVYFIWDIADVLRDLFKRGKYPDAILPMCVIRRMDSVLEPTKQKVLDTKKLFDETCINEQRTAFTRRFYKPKPQRTLKEISVDMLAIENESEGEGLLDGLLKVGAK